MENLNNNNVGSKHFVPPELSNEEDKRKYLLEKKKMTTICPYNSTHIIRVKNYSKHCRGCPDNPCNRPGYNASYILKDCNIPKYIFIKSTEQTLLEYLDDSFFETPKPLKKNPYYSCKCADFNLSGFPEDKMIIMKKRIRKLYNYLVEKYPEIAEPVLNNPEIVGNVIDQKVFVKTIDESRVSMPESWEYSIKHSCQCFSIIAHLEEHGIIKTKYDDLITEKVTHIIEGGAGTGMLSAYLSLINNDPEARKLAKEIAERELKKSISEAEKMDEIGKEKRVTTNYCPPASSLLPLTRHQRIFYLIERTTGYKRKFDRYCRSSGEPTVRIPADLSDVKLKLLIDSELPKHSKVILEKFGITYSVDKSNEVAVIGKHLCGSATDITIKMAIDACSNLENNLKFKGIGIALCCHSKGDGHAYINQEFFAKLGVTTLELTVLHRICSWALAFRTADEKDIDNESESEFDEQPISANEKNQIKVKNPGRSILLPGDDRKEIGEMCKTILNIGRVIWLKQQSIVKDAGLIKYIQKEKSPENVLLWCSGK